ncbi:O-antigen ligase family protein [Lysinibacillus sp. NPDC098008]|uniref:O-antigen ligase family protein n=1 Tax=Lysinibacillus sp. NPDC098008 TaxID=3364146 RepID=UPI00381F3BF0
MKTLFIMVFMVLVLGADLKVTIFPYIHWGIWCILIFPMIIKGIFKKGLVLSPMLSLASLLIIIGMISSFFWGINTDNAIQIVKLCLILLTLYYFLYYSEIGWKEIDISINVILILNFIFLILGILGFTGMASLMTADGRWGTFFAYPGSLVKIGAWGFYFNILSLLLLEKKIQKINRLILLIMSLFIIYMDGSRTGMLIIFATLFIILLIYFLINYRNKFKAFIVPIYVISIFLSGIIILLPDLLKSRVVKSIFNLFNSTSISKGLELVDSARFMMLKSAINKIYDSPIIGTGAFTTIGVYEDGSSMVVHNTYLQFWGDFGIFGILGLLLLYFGWLALLPKVFYKLQKNNNMQENILVSSSILMLLYFVINGLFHPYSTELSEWIIFIISLTYFYNYYRENKKEQLYSLIDE